MTKQKILDQFLPYVSGDDAEIECKFKLIQMIYDRVMDDRVSDPLSLKVIPLNTPQIDEYL